MFMFRRLYEKLTGAGKAGYIALIIFCVSGIAGLLFLDVWLLGTGRLLSRHPVNGLSLPQVATGRRQVMPLIMLNGIFAIRS